MHHKTRNLRPIAAALAATGALLAPQSASAAVKGSASLEQQGKACAPQIHPTILAAVVMHESKANPLAIGINGGYRLPRQPRSKAEAIATARWLRANGFNFDAGLGQINVKNLNRLNMSVEDLFDPCLNLRAAAAVLSDCYSRAARVRTAGPQALHAALSCYNTGNFSRGLANGYVRKVAGQAGFVVPPIAIWGAEPERQERLQEVAANAQERGVRRDAFGEAEPDAFSRATSRASSMISGE